MEDIKLMMKKRVIEIYWFVSWCILSPIIILIAIVLMNINSDVPIVNGKPLPDWSIVIGWIIFSSVLIPIPCFAIYELSKAYKKKLSIQV